METEGYSMDLTGAMFGMVLTCDECGAHVGDREKHTAWHEGLKRTAEAAGKGSQAWSMQQPLGGRPEYGNY